MNISIIEQRIGEYQPINQLEELNAFKEIAQELALAGLSRSGFFKQAAFLGGTCLRILYALPRFSEDLDFSLMNKNENFIWAPYLEEIQQEFLAYGLHLEVTDRSQTDSTIRKAILKEDSFCQVLTLRYQRTRADIRVVRIKLEIDTHPPAGAYCTPHVLPFPLPYALVAHDLPTLFAGKLNAIFTRGFDKGRDWFDLFWYINKKVKINFYYLQSALQQFRSDIPQECTLAWVQEQLIDHIGRLDWRQLRHDLSGLLRTRDRQVVDRWDYSLFHSLISAMRG